MMNKAIAGPLTALGVGLLIAMVLASCAGSSNQPAQHIGGDYAGEQLFHLGQASLEEMIASRDVIARVRLSSVAALTEGWDLGGELGIRHFPILEFTLTVQEYLMGTGDRTITASVHQHGDGHESTGDAATVLQEVFSSRDTRWDNREAIVFLTGEHPGPYSLGGFDPEWGPRFGDYYSFASPHTKAWLPEALGALGASSSSSASKRFLLDVPPDGGSGGFSGASGASASTITLSSLKAMISEFTQELAAGGGSDAYAECLLDKREAERVVRDRYQGFEPPLATHYHEVGSGLPAGSIVYPDDYSGDRTPSTRGRWDWVMDIRGKDAHLFVTPDYVAVDTVRPLPAGEYRFYEEWQRASLVICNGQPNEMARDYGIIVTVTAPEGTLHEAFFDPVSSGDAVGYFGAGDALKPTSFSAGDASTTIQSLKWQGSAVIMTLSPYNALAGQGLDLITGDGTTTLSLEASGATGDSASGALTWAVGSQPWSSGDELMLRIREANAPPVFGEDSYTFSVAEDAAVGVLVGAVSATDRDGDSLTYSITGGNGGGTFAIDGGTGRISLASSLDHGTTPSYSLTVEVSDGNGGKGSVTVTIAVTAAAE